MLALIFTVLLLFPSVASAALCDLWWNPSTDPKLDGYAVYTSLVSGQYTQGPAWIGNGTSTTCDALGLSVDNLRHYFIVKVFTTENVFSAASNEVSKVLGVIQPPPPPPPRICLKYNPKGKCVKWSN